MENEKISDLPKVSIIITTLNNEQTIGECLKSIFELNYPKELLEVIVVDGGSKDSTTKIAQNYPAKIIVKQSNAPAAYNYAINHVESEVVGIIDADAKVEKEWLNKLIAHLKDPQVAGVSGTIETWNSERLLPRCIGYDLKYRYSRIKGETKRVATMNLLLKKHVIKEMGGFNENLPTQYDTELGVRITSKGYKIILEPQAKCYHFNRPTWKEYFKQQLHYGKNTSRLYLKSPKLIRGDAITDFWMNIQPILIAAAILLVIAGFFEKFMWYVSASILAFLLIFYLASAVKLSYSYKDASAMLLVVVYFARAIAWTLGGAISVVKILKAGED
jgi:cellulose synthase/poly-beta-1,6-N-acetylglucosamine synthase-like glycosyltransferase